LKQAVARAAKRLAYWASAGLLALCVKLVFRANTMGRDNIPPKGVIIVARHQSFWDIPLVATALGWRRQLTFVARKTLYNEHFWLRPHLNMFAIQVDRDRFSTSDFKNVMRAVNADQPVVVFPEGAIRRTGQVYPGVIRFAERSMREILPVRFEARKGRYPPSYPLGFPALTLVIGSPFTIRDLEFDLSGDETKDERYEKLALGLLARIDDAEAGVAAPARKQEH